MITAIPAPSHGGDVERVAREHGISASDLLDFSANINPLGLPLRARQRLALDTSNPDLILQYPDPEATELRRILRRRLDVPMDSIVVGNGAGALIAASVRAFEARDCLIPVPAFCEYERACAASGCRIHRVKLDAQNGFRFDPDAVIGAMKQNAADLLIVNNPHNPSGALIDCVAMRRLLDAASASGVNILIDEAFIDYAPGSEITAEAARRPGVIAVRSLTKFYGCPALRVGYAVAAPDIAERLAAQLPAWPVTTLALNALTEALQDRAYIRQTLEENSLERERLASALVNLGLQVFPSAANFLLLRLPEGCCSSTRLRERLIAEHHVLVRNCDSFHDLEQGRYVRVAVKSERDNNLLMHAITECLRP